MRELLHAALPEFLGGLAAALAFAAGTAGVRAIRARLRK